MARHHKCLIHMAHKSGNISEVSKSSSDWLDYTGFLGDACVAFFNVPSGNKDAVTPNPLTKEESHRVYNCDCKCLSGSNKKVCEIFKVYSRRGPIRYSRSVSLRYWHFLLDRGIGLTRPI